VFSLLLRLDEEERDEEEIEVEERTTLCGISFHFEISSVPSAMSDESTSANVSEVKSADQVEDVSPLESAVKIRNTRRADQPLELTRIRSRWLENQKKKQEHQLLSNPTGWRVVQVSFIVD